MMSKSKIVADSAWSYTAFAVMAASGVLLNLVIGDVRGAVGLGVFSQVMAVFVIAAHLSVFGLHNAAFRAIVLAPAEAAGILSSAVAAALPFGCGTMLVLFAAAQPLGAVLDSPDTGRAILWLAPGILFFGVNKIGLAALNALLLMRRYAIGQMLRYVTLGGALVAVVFLDWPLHHFGTAFTIAEVIVTLYLLTATASITAPGPRLPQRSRVAALLRFGSRSAASGLLTEINLRVDVLMLGWFLSDRAVGIYAIAAMVIEGVGNIALVVRNLVNPHLTRLLVAGDQRGLGRLIGRIQLAAVPFLVFLMLMAWLLFQPVIRLLLGQSELDQALAPLVILLGLMIPYFSFYAFEEAFMLAGRAGMQSLYHLGITVMNVMLNLVLIPIWGIEGAAAATGLASLLACVILVTGMRMATGHTLLPGWTLHASAR